ncbi:MAG: STAS domain-containing protein [Gaiellales bacterium]
MAEMVPLGAVTVDRQDGVWVVALTGEHDLATVDELRITLDSLLAPETRPLSQPTLVVVDLSEAAFVDSSVISAITRAHEAARDDSGARVGVVVDSPESFAARLLDLLGLARVLPIYSSRATGVAALLAPQPAR